ncbi:MAG: DUF2288 domain-containing protein [Gloeocapsa sp. DLM2.Bin57]|nr:MAG: DUF2288 domain-containing protein [Gloeocapsa sp. DLM2.Bin57]
MTDIKIQLSEELATIQWKDIIPHAQRDVVIVVNPNLDLLDVGEAIALNNTNKIQDWICESLITKPLSEQLSQWNQNPNKEFNALIVQPFVLVQSFG